MVRTDEAIARRSYEDQQLTARRGGNCDVPLRENM
jgi:hypothetical protein